MNATTEKIRQYLGQYTSNYVIIGGTALGINIENAGLIPRSTKDIDMIVICEAINADYVKAFWKLIKDGGYKVSQVVDENGKTKNRFYRFSAPKEITFPVIIELFSRVPDTITLPEGMEVVHIPVGDDLSSFSAIFLDEDYYAYAVAHSREDRGLRYLNPEALIVLKAKAFLNNRTRKENGEQVDQKDINKHKNDVFRMSLLLSTKGRFDVPDTIKKDLLDFLSIYDTEGVDTKNITKSMHAPKVSQEDSEEIIKNAFGL